MKKVQLPRIRLPRLPKAKLLRPKIARAGGAGGAGGSAAGDAGTAGGSQDVGDTMVPAQAGIDASDNLDLTQDYKRGGPVVRAARRSRVDDGGAGTCGGGAGASFPRQPR
jgi:hypothetical protein